MTVKSLFLFIQTTANVDAGTSSIINIVGDKICTLNELRALHESLQPEFGTDDTFRSAFFLHPS